MMKIAPTLLLAFSLGALDPTRVEQPDVAHGRARFQGGAYAEAAGHFRAGLARRPGDVAIGYDLAAALYQRALELPAGAERDALLAEAAPLFDRAAGVADQALRAAALYDLGNTRFQQGRFPEAIEAYKQVLRLDPGRDDARYNLELALRRLPQPPPQPPPPEPQPGGEPPPEPPATQPQPQPPPSAGDDLDWKLDALERRSRELEAELSRSRAPRPSGPVKDW
jgi:tetratricopeptide (TPR) repeat protein